MKRIFKVLFEFLVAFSTAIIVSNRSICLFKLLTNLGIHNSNLQNTVISFIVTFIANVALVFLSHIYFKIFFPMQVAVTSDKNQITFAANNNNEYEPQELNMCYEVTPGGKFTMWILKRSSIDLLIFFNPDYVDMTLEEDKKWALDSRQEKLEFTEKKNQLHYLVLEKYFPEGKVNKKFTVSVQMKIRPKKVQNQEISLNYDIKGKKKINTVLFRILFKVNICNLKCKGVGNE